MTPSPGTSVSGLFGVTGNRAVPLEGMTVLKSFNPMPFVIIGGACIAGVLRVDLIALAIITGAVTGGVLAARLTPKLKLW
jgi:hypothetical protein